MGEQRHIRTRSWNGKPTKRCSANDIVNEFIVVDDDEVIILDFPESSKSKAPGTSRIRNESVLPRVISIDDDDDDDDDTENVHKAGTSSSRNSLAANLQTSPDVDNEDCIFVREKCVGFRLSKCKQTSSTMPSSGTGTRFGLGPESESESDSDCEILDGSHRKAREQWEKAFLEKMKRVFKTGLTEEAGPSNLNFDTNFEPGFESKTKQHDQKSSFAPVRDPDGGKETSPTFVGTKKSGKASLSKEAGPSNLNCDTNFRPDIESRTEEHDQTSSFIPTRNSDDGKDASPTFVGTEKSGKAGLSEEAGPSNPISDSNFRNGFRSGTKHRNRTPNFVPERNPDSGKRTSPRFVGTKKSGKAGLSEETGPSNRSFDSNFRPGFRRGTEQRDRTSYFVPARNSHLGKETSPTFVGTEKSGKASPREELDPSDIHCDTNSRPGFENGTEQCDRTSYFVPARNPDRGKETSPTFVGTEKSGKASPSEELDPSDIHGDTNSRPGFESGTEQHDQTSYFFPARNPDGGKRTDDRNPSTSLFGSRKKENNRANSWFSGRESYLWSSPPEKQVEHERSYSPSTHFASSKRPVHQNNVDAVDEPPDKVQAQCGTSQSPEENQKKKAEYQFYTKDVVEEEDASKSSRPRTSNGDEDTTHMRSMQSNGARCEQGISNLGEPLDFTIDPIPSTSGQVQDLHDTAPEIEVMLNREKLKDTDQYKKAQEEEWESRKRQLQLQAEEAQRQRKRIKLANMRQQEMERRQKERVEEVRETQKKDEESMNMKETLRAEITKSLKLIEIKSSNMASLLRSLGIHVGGGTSPLPHEVHAAYKRAALKFHPDRAARGDIKQQVEAEEKFKLIGRMKDKFLS